MPYKMPQAAILAVLFMHGGGSHRHTQYCTSLLPINLIESNLLKRRSTFCYRLFVKHFLDKKGAECSSSVEHRGRESEIL